MRKKLISMVAVAMTSLGVYAQSNDNVTSNPLDKMEPLTPTYLEGVYESDIIGSNWFLTISGGTSAFVGKPVGHGDFFDRLTPYICSTQNLVDMVILNKSRILLQVFRELPYFIFRINLNLFLIVRRCLYRQNFCQFYHLS